MIKFGRVEYIANHGRNAITPKGIITIFETTKQNGVSVIDCKGGITFIPHGRVITATYKMMTLKEYVQKYGDKHLKRSMEDEIHQNN